MEVIKVLDACYEYLMVGAADECRCCAYSGECSACDQLKGKAENLLKKWKEEV